MMAAFVVCATHWVHILPTSASSVDISPAVSELMRRPSFSHECETVGMVVRVRAIEIIIAHVLHEFHAAIVLVCLAGPLTCHKSNQQGDNETD